MKEFIEIEATAKSRQHRRLILGLGINDADYQVYIKLEGRRITCHFYRTWVDMLTRCYSPNYHKRRPTYIGCSVVQSWLTFSVFKQWMQQQDWQGKQLDKDLLLIGNKHYSPDTCIFISHALNNLLNVREAARGRYKIGVCWSKTSKKFMSACTVDSESICLGFFDTEEEAHLTYIKFKQAHVLKIAELQESPKLRQALITYANNILSINS